MARLDARRLEINRLKREGGIAFRKGILACPYSDVDIRGVYWGRGWEEARKQVARKI